ncbi:MAG: heme o synthase [Chitinophagaceae bacterium]|nr:heme o synthase [Chitinophagaceae bacterium]
MKFTLSFTVVFSSVVCYLLAPGISFDFLSVLLLFVGGMLVTGSANAINQIVEKDTDALMQRTLKRPIASGRMSSNEGWIFAFCSALIGIFILGIWFNWLTAIISLFSLFLYAFVYTPLKKIHGIAVMVGAIPGALPCLIGWVAGTDSLSLGGWILFCIQFFWQFPHFWAIAWVSYNDYSKAGFKLLPDKGGPTKFAAIQSILYQVILVPLCVLPYFAQMTGKYSLIILCVANIFMLWQCIRLYIEMDIKAARRVMFGSYGYLPIVLLALLADKLNG